MGYGTVSTDKSGVDAFREGLCELGYVEGTKPSDLPVEQPSKLDLILNLKTAKQIGLTIPPSVLARADRVIK
jgi:putative tryptophan/tyrosine transport system substrate-binding protein